MFDDFITLVLLPIIIVVAAITTTLGIVIGIKYLDTPTKESCEAAKTTYVENRLGMGKCVNLNSTIEE